MLHNNQQETEHSILLVDDDAEFLDGARRALLVHGMGNVTTLLGGSRVIQSLASGKYSVLLLDWVMPDYSGADILPEVVRQFPHIPVIIITGVSDLDNVVSCIKQGAYDYMTKPIDTTRLVSIVQNAVKSSELEIINRKLTRFLLGSPLSNPEKFSNIVTSSERMISIFKVIETLACSRQPVLITGETGVGKELIAEAIHKCSGLKGKMVTVNAAGLDDAMLADTLFGHKKGAFTGATERRDGLIEQAKGGTLFLDEIGDLCNSSQIKLLRLLQQNEYYRIGSDLLHKSDARIIAASNGNFQELMSSGAFRDDLYYRISGHLLHVPPLRERPEDVIPLVRHFVSKAAHALEKPVPVLSDPLCHVLLAYDFPGNVRELINMVNNAVAQSSMKMLVIKDFPALATSPIMRSNIVRKIGEGNDCQFVLHSIFKEFPTVSTVEALLVEDAMTMAHGNRSIAAKMLGISRPTLQKRIEDTADNNKN